jgi:pyrroloquinoline-quinone synthase
MGGNRLTATASLADASSKFDLLQHSFYQRWSAGTLTREELDDYAGQYAYVVAGLPGWLRDAAIANPEHALELERHAHEEDGHVALWQKFAMAVDPARAGAFDHPNPATVALLERCDELAAAGQAVTVAWAMEAQSPEVSEAKLDGLRRHYGIDATSGGEYFELHRDRDREHRDELAAMIPAGDPRAAGAAEAVFSGLWDLLTSVERAA